MKFSCVFLSVLFLSEGANVPSFFFEKCKKNDINLGKCLTDSANKGWPKFVKEYKLNKIPLDNVHTDIPNLLIADFSGHLSGLEDVIFNNIYVNFVKKTFDVIYTQPILTLLGDYKAKGSFLGLVIDEHGYANTTLSNGIYKNQFSYEFQERDNEKYIQLTNSKLSYNIDRLRVNLTSIDNPERGEQITTLFNNFWGILNILVENELSILISDAYLPYIREFLNKIPEMSLFEK